MSVSDRLFIEIGATESEQAESFENGTLQHDESGRVAFTIQTEIDVPDRVGRRGPEAVAAWLEERLSALVDVDDDIRFSLQVGPSDDAVEDEEDEEDDDELDEEDDPA